MKALNLLSYCKVSYPIIYLILELASMLCIVSYPAIYVIFDLASILYIILSWNICNLWSCFHVIFLMSNWASRCTNQMSEVCMKNGGTLMETCWTESSEPSASEDLSIGEGWRAKTYLFVTVYVFIEWSRESRRGSPI